jgi:hypothetical protein
MTGDESIQLFEECAVALARILFERFAIVRQIIEKRFDSLFI